MPETRIDDLSTDDMLRKVLTQQDEILAFLEKQDSRLDDLFEAVENLTLEPLDDTY
jgi:hypothetical protein